MIDSIVAVCNSSSWKHRTRNSGIRYTRPPVYPFLYKKWGHLLSTLVIIGIFVWSWKLEQVSVKRIHQYGDWYQLRYTNINLQIPDNANTGTGRAVNRVVEQSCFSGIFWVILDWSGSWLLDWSASPTQKNFNPKVWLPDWNGLKACRTIENGGILKMKDFWIRNSVINSCSTSDFLTKRKPDFNETWIRNSGLLHHSNEV